MQHFFLIFNLSLKKLMGHCINFCFRSVLKLIRKCSQIVPMRITEHSSFSNHSKFFFFMHSKRVYKTLFFPCFGNHEAIFYWNNRALLIVEKQFKFPQAHVFSFAPLFWWSYNNFIDVCSNINLFLFFLNKGKKLLFPIISDSNVTKSFSTFMASVQIISFNLFFVEWQQCEMLELRILKGNVNRRY